MGNTETREQVAALLRDLRDRAGLSQSKLARRLHRSTTYVSKIERSERGIELAGVAQWAAACGCRATLGFAALDEAGEIDERRLEAAPTGPVEKLAAVMPQLDDDERALVDAFVGFLGRKRK